MTSPRNIRLGLPLVAVPLTAVLIGVLGVPARARGLPTALRTVQGTAQTAVAAPLPPAPVRTVPAAPPLPRSLVAPLPKLAPPVPPVRRAPVPPVRRAPVPRAPTLPLPVPVPTPIVPTPTVPSPVSPPPRFTTPAPPTPAPVRPTPPLPAPAPTLPSGHGGVPVPGAIVPTPSLPGPASKLPPGQAGIPAPHTIAPPLPSAGTGPPPSGSRPSGGENQWLPAVRSPSGSTPASPGGAAAMVQAAGTTAVWRPREIARGASLHAGTYAGTLAAPSATPADLLFGALPTSALDAFGLPAIAQGSETLATRTHHAGVPGSGGGNDLLGLKIPPEAGQAMLVALIALGSILLIALLFGHELQLRGRYRELLSRVSQRPHA